MRYCVLASGSRGNCLFIESGYARILIDAGISAREIENRLRSIQIEPESIDALVLAHSHGDHVRGVGVFSRRFSTPIYAHPQTLDEITRLLRGKEEFQVWNKSFHIKDLFFTPFRVSHDCEPTVGYLVQEHTKTLAVCTDLGVVTEDVRSHLRLAQAIVLESNHDPDMLINGPYPWHLKERIASRIGHLSNYEAAHLLNEIMNGGINQIILGHLSEENNTAEKVAETILSALGNHLESVVKVIEQRQMSQLFTL